MASPVATQEEVATSRAQRDGSANGGWNMKFYDGPIPGEPQAQAAEMTDPNAKYMGSANPTPQAPTEAQPQIEALKEQLRRVFGEEAGDAERVLAWGDPKAGSYGQGYGGENRQFNPRAENTANNDGSMDRGLFQINSNTFTDFQNRHGDKMAALGINTYEDMFDPTKNMLMAQLIKQEQGWAAWYGSPPDLRNQRP